MDSRAVPPHTPGDSSGYRRKAEWRDPTPAEAKRHGITAKILDVLPGQRLEVPDQEKALRRALGISHRQWKKRRRQLRKLMEQAAAMARQPGESDAVG